MTTKWPQQAEVLSGRSMYGDPHGTHGEVNPKWYKDNIVQITPAYKMTYAGQPIKKISCHKLVADSLHNVLTAIREGYNNDEAALHASGASIYGGCYNYRLMRGGSQLSMHSWGCAIDLDPARNYLYDSTPFFESNHIVRGAFAAEGWTWGGDWDGDGYVKDERKPDGMHWQATQLVK